MSAIVQEVQAVIVPSITAIDKNIRFDYNYHCDVCGDTLVTDGRSQWCQNQICNNNSRPIRP